MAFLVKYADALDTGLIAHRLYDVVDVFLLVLEHAVARAAGECVAEAKGALHRLAFEVVRVRADHEPRQDPQANQGNGGGEQKNPRTQRR